MHGHTTYALFSGSIGRNITFRLLEDDAQRVNDLNKTGNMILFIQFSWFVSQLASRIRTLFFVELNISNESNSMYIAKAIVCLAH